MSRIQVAELPRADREAEMTAILARRPDVVHLLSRVDPITLAQVATAVQLAQGGESEDVERLRRAQRGLRVLEVM